MIDKEDLKDRSGKRLIEFKKRVKPKEGSNSDSDLESY